MRVVLTQEAREEFLDLPRLVQARLAGPYRIRTGDYRVQFRAEKERIVIVTVRHREGFYDE